MFYRIHLKARHFYFNLSKFYTSIITEHPLVSIICYLLLIIIFGFGLFHLKFNSDTESLSFIRNSKIKFDVQKLKETFPQNQYERYFQHQLTDLGNFKNF
jgi:hypothetical protein